MLEKEPLGNGLVRVTFRVSNHLWADHIALVGEFNDWERYRHLLQQTNDDDDWHITLELEAGRSYRFRYLVDGNEWMADNHADAHELNSYGGVDCVVIT
jgi:1,4-alpha-glucan branching enzyme